MELNLTSWCDPNFSSRKLPKEEEIRSFFQSFSTTNPSIEKSFFHNVFKWNYSPNHEHPYRREEDIFPVLSRNYRNQISGIWITPFLSNLSPDNLSLGYHSEISEPNFNNTPTRMRKLPPIAFKLDKSFTEDLEFASEAKSIERSVQINSIRDMVSLKSYINGYIDNFIDHEILTFKKALESKNYIQTLSHQEILNKINKIKEAYPSEPVYILADYPLLKYLHTHCQHSPGQLLRNAWLIQGEANSHRYRETGFSDYKSAIFTTADMKASHSFEMGYAYQRGSRVWEIYFGIVAKLAMDIPEDPCNKESKLVTRSKSNSRWDNLL